MKKSLIVVFAIAMATTTNVNAQYQDNQHDPRLDLKFGLKAGFNYTNVWDSKGEDFVANPRFGFAGGFFASIPIGATLGFQPEILFSQKGFQAAGTLLGEPYSFERRTNYLDLPLQLQIKPTTFLTLLAGPQYSWLINESNEYNFWGNIVGQEDVFNSDKLRRSMLGFVTGLDLYFKNIVVSGRYGWDFQSNYNDGISATPRYKNRWLQFTVGLSL